MLVTRYSRRVFFFSFGDIRWGWRANNACASWSHGWARNSGRSSVPEREYVSKAHIEETVEGWGLLIGTYPAAAATEAMVARTTATLNCILTVRLVYEVEVEVKVGVEVDIGVTGYLILYVLPGSKRVWFLVDDDVDIDAGGREEEGEEGEQEGVWKSGSYYIYACTALSCTMQRSTVLSCPGQDGE